ncbi:hypothetical protein ACTD5D_12875 [Nocardia takedensis]|uniref:hypothetical protein n=1 Tax=Nocardia takedensis TaxID=259390 RepID=UPI0005932D5A|nr:hypothetical protein [Nocardia takedensis]
MSDARERSATARVFLVSAVAVATYLLAASVVAAAVTPPGAPMVARWRARRSARSSGRAAW